MSSEHRRSPSPLADASAEGIECLRRHLKRAEGFKSEPPEPTDAQLEAAREEVAERYEENPAGAFRAMALADAIGTRQSNLVRRVVDELLDEGRVVHINRSRKSPKYRAVDPAEVSVE